MATARTDARRTTRPAAKAAPTPVTRRKAASAPGPKTATRGAQKMGVTDYADKPATDYHKAFARWIVREVGYNPKEADSLSAAFLAGVSIATAARPAFMNSEFLEEWRESTGQAKRGPKGNAEAEEVEEAPKARTTRRKPTPIVEEVDEDDDEFDEEDADEDDDEFDDEDDDEFDEDSDEDEEEEVAPVRRGRGRPAGSTNKTVAAKRAPAKVAAKPATRSKAKATADEDDEFLF